MMSSLLNDFFNLHLSQSQLEHYALQLGSDCPFFIANKPMYATGRGECMNPVDLDLSDYSIQLICPKLHISTVAAFKGIVPKPASFALENLTKLDIAEWKQHVFNDFEQTLFPHYPVLQQIKEQLYAQGAIFASLSGTGATVYGIFPKGRNATVNIEIPFDSFTG